MLSRIFSPYALSVARNKSLQLQRTFASSANNGTNPKSSSRAPWVFAAVIAGGIGGYMAYGPAEKRDQAKQSVHNVKEQAKDKINAKASQAHEQIKELDEKRAPKNNTDGDSEARHKKAATTNQYKEREGVFSGKTFDNHETSHSSNPGSDFEETKKSAKK